jgi:hypothetical protein
MQVACPQSPSGCSVRPHRLSTGRLHDSPAALHGRYDFLRDDLGQTVSRQPVVAMTGYLAGMVSTRESGTMRTDPQPLKTRRSARCRYSNCSSSAK